MSRAGERLRAWMAMLGGRREQTGAPGGDGDREERAVNAILPDDDEPGWRASSGSGDGGVQRPWHIVRGLLLQAASRWRPG
jgi:hypothetical protein